jgi:hypothetical protein
VDDLTDIYSETRVVDMLRGVDDVAVDRVNDANGSVHVVVEVASKSVARLIREMVALIDGHARVSHPRMPLIAAG